MTEAKIVIEEVKPGIIAMQVFVNDETETRLERHCATLFNKLIEVAFEEIQKSGESGGFSMASTDPDAVRKFADECLRRVKEG